MANRKTPNQIVNEAYKALKKLSAASGGMSEGYDYASEQKIKEQLDREVRITGFTEVLGKKGIFQLITMQRKLRFMREHTFYMLFDYEELKG